MLHWPLLLALTASASLLVAAPAAAQGAAAKTRAGMQSAGSLDSTIVRLERAAWEGVKSKSGEQIEKAFGTNWSYIDPNGIVRVRAGDVAKMIADCETGSYEFSDVAVRPIGSNAAVLTYRATVDQTCKGEKSPSPIYVVSVYEKRNGRWQGVVHSETTARQ